MKKLLYFCMVLLSISHTVAQTVEWSNQQKTKSKTYYSQVLGENSSGLYVARTKNSDFREDVLIEKYKSNLALESSVNLFQPDNSTIERVIVIEGGLLEFALNKNTTTQKTELLLVQLDNAVSPISTKSLFAFDGPLGSDRKIQIKASADKKNFTVFYLCQASDKTKSIMSVYGYDQSFTLKYNRKFSIPYPLEDLDLRNMECDNQGNVYALVGNPKEGKRARDRYLTYFLYTYSPSTDNMLEYVIGNDSSVVNEINLVVNNYANVVNIAGFYSDKNDRKCVGTVYYKLNTKTAEMEVKQVDLIDLSFSSRIAGTMLNERTPVLSDLYIRKLVANSDGGCTIIAEKYSESKQAYTYTVNGFPQTNYRTVYNYDEIVVIAKNADGSLRFRDFIKKNQTSMSDGGYYSSFVTLLANDKIGIIYNADVVNDGDVMLTTISNKGVFEQKVLIKSMSYYATIMPFESRQVSGNSAIISTLKDRRFCLMRLTF